MGWLMLSGSVYTGRRTPTMKGNKKSTNKEISWPFCNSPCRESITCFALLHINVCSGSAGLNNP